MIGGKELNLIVEGLIKGRALWPFPLLGGATDNDSEFLNELWLRDCQQQETGTDLSPQSA